MIYGNLFILDFAITLNLIKSQKKEEEEGRIVSQNTVWEDFAQNQMNSSH